MVTLCIATVLLVAAGPAVPASSAAQSSSQSSAPASQPDACDNGDGAWSSVSFVLVTEPAPGARVTPGFVVRGCSRTFESNVTWRLLGREGKPIREGHATGGGVDGPGRFRFTLDYTVDALQVAYLEVDEPSITETEGFPPPRTIIPLVLQPASPPDAAEGVGGATMPPTGDWTLELLEGQPLALERPITFSLDDTGRVSGFAGCNRYFTQWVEQDGRVRLGPVGATRMYCPDTMESETRFLAALSKVTRFRRAGSHLELTGAEGAVLLRFTSGPA